MDKPAYVLIAARFTSSTFSGCKDQIEQLLAPAGKDATNPEFGMYVLRVTGPAYWIGYDLCDYLRRADVPFVRVEFSTPLAGSLSPAGQKALEQIGVEFWNKNEK